MIMCFYRLDAGTEWKHVFTSQVRRVRVMKLSRVFYRKARQPQVFGDRARCITSCHVQTQVQDTWEQLLASFVRKLSSAANNYASYA